MQDDVAGSDLSHSPAGFFTTLSWVGVATQATVVVFNAQVISQKEK